MSDSIRLWTGQQPIAWEALNRDGVYHVKWKYVSQKYGDTAWSFRIAYAFLAQAAQARGLCPPGSQSAIWLYGDPAWICQDETTRLLCLDIPAKRVLTFDLRLWTRILNLEYLGTDPEDEAHFQQELEHLGLYSTLPTFQTPFYPVQKRQIQASWSRLLQADGIPAAYLQAAVWELRQEWLVAIEPPY